MLREVQRSQSWCDPPLQISGRRMGQIRPSEQHLTRLHGNRNLRLRSTRNESYLAQQDSNGEGG
jgi:hypothetical protein